MEIQLVYITYKMDFVRHYMPCCDKNTYDAPTLSLRRYCQRIYEAKNIFEEKDYDLYFAKPWLVFVKFQVSPLGKQTLHHVSVLSIYTYVHH